MKKLLAFLIILCLTSISFGVIGPTCVWEIRTTGAQANGGGYTSGGTDYSQQAAAQLSKTDLASVNPWTTVTSATSGFTVAMIGNILHISSGTNFTPGWYEIATYVDAGTITVDRACGTTGDASSGVGAIGGAFLFGGALDDEFLDAAVGGNIIYWKSGAYISGEVVSMLGTSAASTVIIDIRGYTTTRNDTCNLTDRPYINFDTDGDGITFSPYCKVKNLSFGGTSNITNQVSFDTKTFVLNCRFNNTCTTDGKKAVSSSSYGVMEKCEVICTDGVGIMVGTGSSIIDCYIHDCNVTARNSVGIMVANTGKIINCILSKNNIGIDMATGYGNLIMNNTIYNCDPNGIKSATSPYAYSNAFLGNIITNCKGGATWTTNIPNNYWNNNCFYNTYDVNGVTAGPDDLLATNPLLTAPGSGDFTLQAGSPCLGQGAVIDPNTGVVGTYPMNIGADQDDNAAGGSTINYYLLDGSKSGGKQ